MVELESPLLKEQCLQMDTLGDILELLEQSIRDECPISPKDGGVIKTGYDSEVDEYRDLAENGKSVDVYKRQIHTCMSAFGNVIFLGYPLITALYGAEGLFYAIIYALVNDSFVWTLCVYLMGKESGNRTKSPVKNLINPNTVSFVIAIPMLCLGLKLPGLIHDALASVGSLTTYLSMLFRCV